MLRLALFLLSLAALIGARLAVIYLKGPQAEPPPAEALIIHAVLGAASLLAVVLAVRRGVAATGMGTAGFGPIALGLLALTLALGLILALTAWRRHHPAAMLVGAHASLAIAAFVVLMTLVALG